MRDGWEEEEELGPQDRQHWKSKQARILTTPALATRSLTMLSLLAGRARLLRCQHLH
jgi:hypothetical protein